MIRLWWIPVLWIKQVTYWHLIVIALTENTSAQMDSNFSFKLTADPRDSHTFATHRNAIFYNFPEYINEKENISSKYLIGLIRFSCLLSGLCKNLIMFWVIFMQKSRNSKGFTNFTAALYIYIYIYVVWLWCVLLVYCCVLLRCV